MSILLYRDLDGRDIKIKNPTSADLSECSRVICKRNKAAIEREFLQGMRSSVLIAALTDSQP